MSICQVPIPYPCIVCSRCVLHSGACLNFGCSSCSCQTALQFCAERAAGNGLHLVVLQVVGAPCCVHLHQVWFQCCLNVLLTLCLLLSFIQLQDLLQRLSAAQQLVQRVMDLEAVNQQQQTTISTLQQQLLSSEQRAGELSSELAAWQARGSKAEQQVAELQQQLRVSTPRPQRDLGLLSDLLTPEESLLVEQALITGDSHPLVRILPVPAFVLGMHTHRNISHAILRAPVHAMDGAYMRTHACTHARMHKHTRTHVHTCAKCPHCCLRHAPIATWHGA